MCWATLLQTHPVTLAAKQTEKSGNLFSRHVRTLQHAFARAQVKKAQFFRRKKTSSQKNLAFTSVDTWHRLQNDFPTA
jgi:hypothetical protein